MNMKPLDKRVCEIGQLSFCLLSKNADVFFVFVFF